MADDIQPIRPKPLRPPSFTVTSTSSPSTPSTPAESSSETFVSRTRSVLNLTSSTLFGIYAPTEHDFSSTPWGAGSQTPLPRASPHDDSRPPVIGPFEKPQPSKDAASHRPRDNKANSVVLYGFRAILLFLFGVAYGIIISHLHDSRQLAPVQVQGIERWSWGYLVGWGLVAVTLGGLTPWVDQFWEDILGISKDVFLTSRMQQDRKTHEQSPGSARSGLGADWNPVVRSIGAFVGIAFAIRKLPWQSTLQVSLTLALVNPVLWYLVDRSKPGFLLSTVVGLAGTAIVFGVNPDIVPSPASPSPRAGATGHLNFDHGNNLHFGLVNNETIGVSTWVASVLFCSSVCFGNIGRKLALVAVERKPGDS